jgi:hypothetical protein
MDKKTKNYIGVGAAFVVAILIAAYFYYYKPLKEDNSLKDKEIDDLKHNIEDLENTINENNDISKDEKAELSELVLHFNDFDEDVAQQITSALSFINIGNILEGIRKLGVLSENLLEKLYSNNDSCRKWLKAKGKPFNAGNMLLYCKEEDKKITNSEYGALFFLKEIRNDESHNINVKLKKFIEKSGLTVAVGSIKILSVLCYPPIEGDS